MFYGKGLHTLVAQAPMIAAFVEQTTWLENKLDDAEQDAYERGYDARDQNVSWDEY